MVAVGANFLHCSTAFLRSSCWKAVAVEELTSKGRHGLPHHCVQCYTLVVKVAAVAGMTLKRKADMLAGEQNPRYLRCVVACQEEARANSFDLLVTK